MSDVGDGKRKAIKTAEEEKESLSKTRGAASIQSLLGVILVRVPSTCNYIV
jgi:hypothetical protein